MTTPLRVEAIAPSGRVLSRGFGRMADGAAIYEWEVDVFPPPSPEAKAFREARLAHGSYQMACEALNIGIAELCALEGGRAVCDWGVARERLTATQLATRGAR